MVFLKRKDIETLLNSNDLNSLKEIAKYYANWMGYKISYQDSNKYLNSLNNNKPKLLDALLKHIQKYESEVFSYK